MNEKNLEYLKNDLKYLGFGKNLQRELEANINSGKADFTLSHKTMYNNQPLESTLHFRKGEQNEMYFFNKYDAKLLKPEERSQTFYLDRGNGITNKEAFNLLNGRAVYKDLTTREGEKYKAWVQLDFSQKEENGNFKMNRYHENYGYDLNKALAQLPIKNLSDPKALEDLTKSLEKGNLQAVKMDVKGMEETYFIKANPQYKDIGVFDSTMSRLVRQGPANKQAGQQQATAVHEPRATLTKSPAPSAAASEDGPELKKKRPRKKKA
ncbi:MAG: hypothetical protein ACTHOB_18230 [Ginsengibacter sp.]